ncbi:MAG: glutathione S-transferase family protein [Porticoccaceae bacterium]
MIKVHGFPVSNYYNMVKFALLEKGFEYEEVLTRPNQDGEFLSKSPMGKVPCLEVREGFLTETNVILEFIEDTFWGHALFPEDAFGKAKVRELMKASELYLELPARELFGAVFFGRPVSDDSKASVGEKLDKGTAALNKLLAFTPYAAGSAMTYADIMLYYTVTLAEVAVQQVYGKSLYDDLPGATEWLELMGKNSNVQQINRDRDTALEKMKQG